MNGNLPTTDILPYVKPRKKRGGNFKIVMIFIVVIAVAALTFVVFMSGKSLFSSFAKNTGGSTGAITKDNAGNVDSSGLNVIPDGARKIINKDMSALSLGKIYENDTDVELIPSGYTFLPVTKNEISVLVICSRGFEEYLESDAEYIDGDYPGKNGTARVDVCARNIAAKLTVGGVGALYVDVGNESLYKSYEKAENVISECLKNYKGIKYVIDIRRGIYFDGEGSFVSPEFELDGNPSAQMRLLVGADGKNFASELAVADTIFAALQAKNRYSVMPTNVKNGTLCGAGDIPVITLEIGGAANTVGEALSSSEFFCDVFASLVTRSS